MSWRILRLLGACGVLTAVAAPACGGSSSDSHATAGGPASGGSGARAGTGGASTMGRAGTAGTVTAPASQACGSKKCSGLVLPVLDLPVQGCCADEATSQCGLDASVLQMFGPTFSETCQPLAQPGAADPACPDSPATPVEGTGLSISFPGCCRPDHVCGYRLDTVGGVLQLGLGCVDSSPFLDGATAQSCGELGAAGAGGDSSGAGAGGDSSAMAGAPGASGSGGLGD